MQADSVQIISYGFITFDPVQRFLALNVASLEITFLEELEFLKGVANAR